MSKTNRTLVQEISNCVEVTDRLRQVLLDFRTTIEKLAEFVNNDEPAVPALAKLNAPIRRRTLTEAMDEFDVARHQMRVALFASALEQGASISEIARGLGISRQLASRIAQEVTERT